MQFSPDSKILVSASRDWTVRRWDALTGKELQRHDGNWAIEPAADGKTFFFAGDAGTILLIDLESGREIRSYKGHTGRVEHLALSHDGKILVSKSLDKTIRVWEVESAKEIRKLDDSAPAKKMVLSPDGKLLALGVGALAVRVLDTKTGQELRKISSGNINIFIESIAFSPDSKLLATGDRQGVAQVWEVSSGRSLHQFPGHPGYLEGLAFSPDGRTLAVGGWGSIRLWELASGKERARFEGFSGDVWPIVFAPDGRTMASGCGDTSILVWNLAGRDLNGGGAKTFLTTKDLDTLWDDLAGLDAIKAYQAIGALADAPDQAVALLAKHLHSTGQVDAKRVEQLIKDLDNDDFDTRDKASGAGEAW